MPRPYAAGMAETFTVHIAIDGTLYHLLVPGASEEGVRAELRADYASGELREYRVLGGTELTVHWSKVATVQLKSIGH
jgi:hypothetical protein